jgi:hypothetical protein
MPQACFTARPGFASSLDAGTSTREGGILKRAFVLPEGEKLPPVGIVPVDVVALIASSREGVTISALTPSLIPTRRHEVSAVGVINPSWLTHEAPTLPQCEDWVNTFSKQGEM